MKKIAIPFVVIFISSVVCNAQPPMPRPEDLTDEQLVQMQTRDMTNWLGLEDETRTAFISTYGAFRGEINTLAKNSRPSKKPESEEEIDKMMQTRFEVSEKLLQIRKGYYAKFRKFLKPSQIRQMYRFENEAGRRMMHGGQGGSCGQEGPGGQRGPGGQGGPGDPGCQGPERFRMGPPEEF